MVDAISYAIVFIQNDRCVQRIYIEQFILYVTVDRNVGLCYNSVICELMTCAPVRICV